MSEPLLKAILRLFAVVAGDGEVTHQERDQIRRFLDEHLSEKLKLMGYLPSKAYPDLWYKQVDDHYEYIA